jgi:hypothetical protein
MIGRLRPRGSGDGMISEDHRLILEWREDEAGDRLMVVKKEGEVGPNHQ